MDSSGQVQAGDLLGPDGPIAGILEGFAPRQEQQTLATAIGHTLDANGTLVAEAGPKVGSTLVVKRVRFPTASYV